MEKQTTLYKLVSTRDLSLTRYIGITTKSIKVRLQKHLYDRNLKNTYKNKWIRKELRDGYAIKIVAIKENLSFEEACKLEIKYISEEKKNNPKLTNTTLGGEGYLGPHSKEHVAKIAKANTGKKRSLEIRKMISNHRKGSKLSEEHKQKIGRSSKGRRHSDATKQKISAAHLGRKHTEAAKNKIRAASTGRFKSKEEIQKRIDKICVWIDQLDLEGNFIQMWKGAHSINQELGIDASSIIKCCNGKRKTAGKFRWQYSARQRKT